MATKKVPERTFVVHLVSGEELHVQSAAEARWFNQSRDTYLSETKFTETTDLRDLDRLLGLELQVFRMTQWLGTGFDYAGYEIDETMVRRNVREFSEQINKTKSSMGLNKSSRDDAAARGDFPGWFSRMTQAAQEFGFKREEELGKAITLMNELSAVVGAYDRSDSEERDRLGFRDEKEIVHWIRTVMLPEFRAIDEYFRKNKQRYWIREMVK